MKLTIQNIGKIEKKASIEINGITVLAGINGSGKSTIGKILYSIYNTFYDSNKQIYEEKIYSIDRLLRSTKASENVLEERNILAHFGYSGYVVPTDEISRMINEYDKEKNVQVIKSWLLEVNANMEPKILTQLTGKIKSMLDISTKDILESLLERRFNAEFNMQLKNFQHVNEESSIKIDIKENQIEIKIGEAASVNIVKGMEILKNIVYIDDPYLLDLVNNPSRTNRYNHKIDIINKIKRKQEESLSVIEDVLLSQQLKEIDNKLNKICSGELKYYSDRGYVYEDKRHNDEVSLVNIATGLKSYIIIKTLLKNGYIEENGIVILDEPEAHLHPEWMRVYAELIVMLQKVFGLNIIISTHSDAFVEFLELASRNNEIIDKCNFYILEENSEGTTEVKDVSNNIELIYKGLGTPFLRASEELDKLHENM